MHHPRIAHTTAFVTPFVEHWLEREIAQWVHPMKDRSDDPSHHERMLLPWSYISLRLGRKEMFYLRSGIPLWDIPIKERQFHLNFRNWLTSLVTTSLASSCSSMSRCSLRFCALRRAISSSPSSTCRFNAFTRLVILSTWTGKEGNVLFNDALNTFYFTVIWKEGRKCFFYYLTMHSTHFILRLYGRKEGFLFFYLTTHSTHFILRLYGIGHMVKDHSDSEGEIEKEREMFYLTTHSTHFIYGYMASFW